MSARTEKACVKKEVPDQDYLFAFFSDLFIDKLTKMA